MKLELEFFFLKDIHKSIITSITREGCGVGGYRRVFFFFLLFLSFSHFYRCPEANSKFSQPRALLSNKTVTEANFFCCCYFLGYFFFFPFFYFKQNTGQ